MRIEVAPTASTGPTLNQEAEPSIFARYFRAEPFVDRHQRKADDAVDVIMPVIHTNELWRPNLTSIYREIPVNRLVLGDGGCIDGSIDVAREFPRVLVLDHTKFQSLGFSIRRLIEAVETEWFVYLHSDVYLPDGWFDTMAAHRNHYDWFECTQRINVMADYLYDTSKIARSYSGSQMGRTAAMSKVAAKIDDDYLYRNEDVILSHLLTSAGHRYGKVADTFHFHQVMFKPSRWRRQVTRVDIEMDIAKDEDIRANLTYARGIVKYVNPSATTPDIIHSVQLAVARLVKLGATTQAEFREWVRRTNSAWLPQLETETRPAWRDRHADRLIAFAQRYRAYGPWATVKHMARRGLSRFRRK